MLILGILLGGLLVPISTQLEQRRISETQRSLNDAKEALLGFAMANGRLPCPADPTIASGAANAGVERASCNTGTNMFGVLPWATLGLPETDGWGRRFTYYVSPSYADSIASATVTPPGSCTDTPTQSSYALCSDGSGVIQTLGGGTSIATAVPAVIVSHGQNGSGAYGSGGTVLVAATNADEVENANTINSTFRSGPYSATFDDIVVWIPNNILKSRTVAAARLP
jgi:type II secretory pathway pseudopilin PulG